MLGLGILVLTAFKGVHGLVIFKFCAWCTWCTKFLLFNNFNGKYPRESPYQFEPEARPNKSNTSDESDSEQSSDLSSSDEEVDREFVMANAWRLETLSWCKCGQCTLSTKAIECFCCHEKALEYDEYDVLLN